MYANEAKGQKFPPNQYAGETDGVAGDCTDPKMAFFFQGSTVYPEYLSDPEVIICASDPDGWQKYEGGRFNQLNDPSLPINPCRFYEMSYLYLGWAVMPQMLCSDPTNMNPPVPGMEHINLGFFEFVNLAGTHDTSVADSAGFLDADYTYDEAYGDITMYRLREGIERFFITDINNPAASAKAQSEIPFCFDKVSTDVTEFNHIPGGSNVLFMDGHVAFIKYPGEWPVTTVMAFVTGQ